MELGRTVGTGVRHWNPTERNKENSQMINTLIHSHKINKSSTFEKLGPEKGSYSGRLKWICGVERQ